VRPLLLLVGLLTAACVHLDDEEGAPDESDDPPATSACDEPLPEDGDGFRPRYEPQQLEADFFAAPWPSDARRTAAGTIDVTPFPDPGVPLIAKYQATLEGSTRGYSTTPVGYFVLQGGVPGALPTPSASLSPTSPVQLVDVSEEGCGARHPVEAFFSPEGDNYLPPGTLAVASVVGQPLERGHTYAFVLTTALEDATGAPLARPARFARDLDDGCDPVHGAALAPLRACLERAGLSPDEVAAAAVFTTQDLVTEAFALRSAMYDDAVVADPVATTWEAESSRFWTGAFDVPIFLDGEAPWDTGGSIHLDEQGRPIVQGTESAPFAVSFPGDPAAGPGGDARWPVVLSVPGTGAWQWYGITEGVPDALRGDAVVITYMAPLHEGREVPGGDPGLHFYNPLNPDATRDLLRQEALELVYLLRLLREDLAARPEFAHVDVDHVVYFGHSQGTQPGAILAAVEPTVRRFVFDGISGSIATTALSYLDNPEYAQISSLILALLQMPETGIPAWHPLLQLTQTGGDAVDPLAYAQAWRGWDGVPRGADVLVFDGVHDTTTTVTAMSSLITGAGLQLLRDEALGLPGWDPDPFGLGLATTTARPVEGNAVGFDGAPRTAAAWLDPDEAHWTTIDSEDAQAAAVAFLLSEHATVP
jgi:hypothetical protein